MFVAGFAISAAFSYVLFMLCGRTRERHFSQLQLRLNDLEAHHEQMIVQPPLPLPPGVGLEEGPGDQNQGYQSGEE